MDYEKKYKDALERASKLRVQNPFDTVSQMMEHVFPELQESEDEKIRKGLIDYFDSANKADENPLMQYGIHTDKILAWLEKQGEIDEEHKSIDKVKPKFHEGEWVVFNNKHQSIYQVEKIENGYYILRHTHGGSFRVCVLHDESLRPWTINDAKDGDVLVYGDNPADHHVRIIMLFKSMRTFNSAFNHFHIFDDKFRINAWCDCGKTAHPATKEQRDILFAKMKDTGYIFDFEKKELKEIVEPKFNVGDTIVPKHNPTTNKIYFTITDITGGKYWYNDRIICDIAKQDEWEVLEQKPAWSEEDDYYRDNLITWLNCGAVRVDLRKDFIDWLKSLRQRINKE